MKALVLTVVAAALARAAPPPAVDVSSGAAVSTAPAAAPTFQTGSADSSRVRLDAQDAAGALADAETAVANDGGADAYAARADAKRALGYPPDEVLVDYAQAAKLDPRYAEKYKGLIAQRDSEMARSGSKPGGTGFPNWPNEASNVIIVLAVGGLVAVVATAMIRGRAS